MLDAPTFPQTVRLADYRVPDWLVPEVALRFELDAASTTVTATLTVTRNGDHARPLVLDGQDLALLSVSIDGVPSDAQPADDTLALDIAADHAVVETVVTIAPAANTKLMGLYVSGASLTTQCEAEGFRRITLRSPTAPTCCRRYTRPARGRRFSLSGAPVERRSGGGGRARPTGVTSPNGPTRGRSPRICSRSSRAGSQRATATASPPRRGSVGRARRSGSRRPTCRAARMRWRR